MDRTVKLETNHCVGKTKYLPAIRQIILFHKVIVHLPLIVPMLLNASMALIVSAIASQSVGKEKPPSVIHQNQPSLNFIVRNLPVMAWSVARMRSVMPIPDDASIVLKQTIAKV